MLIDVRQVLEQWGYPRTESKNALDIAMRTEFGRRVKEFQEVWCIIESTRGFGSLGGVMFIFTAGTGDAIWRRSPFLEKRGSFRHRR